MNKKLRIKTEYSQTNIECQSHVQVKINNHVKRFIPLHVVKYLNHNSILKNIWHASIYIVLKALSQMHRIENGSKQAKSIAFQMKWKPVYDWIKSEIKHKWENIIYDQFLKLTCYFLPCVSSISFLFS